MMRKSFLLKLLMLALCASMVLALFACEGGNVETDPTPDEQTEGKTDPAETDPTESNPAESNPAESNPAESNPAESNPAESNPAESNPAETDPPAPTCDGNHELKAKGDIGHYYTVSCDICGIVKETIAPHTLEDKDGKPTCKDCGHVATCQGVHNYEYNDEGHWKNECLACGAKAVEKAAHEMDHVNGEYVCTVCGFKVTCNGQHELVSDGEAGHHEKACVICNTPDGATVEHTFEDKNGSRFCACGYEAACHGVHQWTSDAEGHQEAACDVCGAVAGEKLPHSEEKAEFVDGNEYSYGCKDCGYGDITRTLEDSVKLYFSPYKISQMGTGDPTNARNHYNLANKAFTIDNEAYFSFTGKDNYAQFIWNRTGAHKDQAYTMDIGLANYAVIKMRLSDTSAKNIKLYYGTAGDRTYTTLPVAASTTGKWATYVIDLAKVFGEYHVLNAESKTYKIDNLYLDLGRLESTTKVDVAYIAFVEGDLAEVAKLVDTDTALLQTANKGAATVVSGETGKCVGGCVNTVQVIDGVYKTACSACGTVVRDHGVKADAVGLYWSAEELYRRSTATTQTSSTEGAYWEGGPVNQYLLTEDGETFLRISDMETKRGTSDSWGGWFPVNSGGGYAHPGSGRYMVIKVRQNDNSVNRSRIDFSVTSAGSSNTWDKGGGFSVYLPEDNQWHVIVVDLAARASGYTPDANDDYGIKTVLLRPFGGYHAVDTVTDEIMDIAYMAFFDDLADLKGIVKEGTYEWSVSDTENETRDTATPEPVVAE